MFESEKSEVTKFAQKYTVRGKCQKNCVIMLNGQIMEEINEFEYLGSTLYEHGRRDTRVLQETEVLGSLSHMMKEDSKCEDIKRHSYHSLIIPTLI